MLTANDKAWIKREIALSLQVNNATRDFNNAPVQVFIADSDPNGIVVASGPALCVAKDGTIWKKSDTTNSTDNWELMIALPQ